MEKKSKIKTVYVVAIVSVFLIGMVFFLGFSAYYYVKIKQGIGQKNEEISKISTSTEEDGFLEIQKSQDLKRSQTGKEFVTSQIYQNSEFGFQLTMTENWETYKVTKVEQYDGSFVINFEHPDGCAFPIFAIETQTWEECKRKKEEKEPRAYYWCFGELGRNEKYVFAPANQPPDCLAGEVKDEVSRIIKSFEQIK